jgi:hypothetical protein
MKRSPMIPSMGERMMVSPASLPARSAWARAALAA